jgi:hypothetical protein
MKIVKLLDYFEDSCPYGFCKFNQYGTCLVDNDDFLANRADEIIENKDNLENTYFDCNYFSVEDGYCEECGRELKKVVNTYEAWGRPVQEERWECPYCD